MSSKHTTPARRVRVEPGIYRRRDGKLEIGWRDASGKQKWRGPFKGLKVARAALATEHARRARGEKVADDPGSASVTAPTHGGRRASSSSVRPRGAPTVPACSTCARTSARAG